MVFSRKQAVGCMVVFLLAVMASADYFAGLPLDQKLINSANRALDQLKSKLEQKFDCSEDSTPKNTPSTNPFSRETKNDGTNFLLNQKINRPNELNNQPQVSPFFQGQFKKNYDRSVFEFRFPSIKTIVGSTLTYFERLQIQKRLRTVADCLAEIKTYLIKYNNVIVGSNNKVDGKHNVVIGSRNSLTGNNHWVFDSDIHANSNQDGVLIIQNYLIEMTDIPDIIIRPYEVIRCINQQQSNRWFRLWWNTATPQRKICF